MPVKGCLKVSRLVSSWLIENPGPREPSATLLQYGPEEVFIK